MKRVLMSCLVLSCVLAHAQELEFKISANHADALYRCGEEAVLTVAAASHPAEAKHTSHSSRQYFRKFFHNKFLLLLN